MDVNPGLIGLLVFGVLATPVFLSRSFSSEATWRWLIGIFIGALGYNFFLSLLPHPQGVSDDAALIGMMAGAVLGSMTAFSVLLQPRESRWGVGVFCALVAAFVLVLYSLDFWSYLKLPSDASRFPGALSGSLPGLCWSQMLLMRAVWLMREGRGLHVPAQRGPANPI